jgi:septal ring-binding cell division protein DamX
MTNEKQFRELKFTSTQLAIVFLAILAFGVCIFLLGISVGKKQTQLAAGAGGAPSVKTESLAQKSPLPAETQPTVTTQTAPGQSAPADTKTEVKPAETKTDDKAGAKVEAKSEAKPPAAPAEKKPAEAKTEPAKKEAKPAEAQQEGIFYIQIGAVNDKEAADGFAQKVEKLGYPTIVLMPLAKDKKPVYRIQIGPYESKQAAADAQDKIAADLKKKKTDFFVVKG